MTGQLLPNGAQSHNNWHNFPKNVMRKPFTRKQIFYKESCNIGSASI